MSRLEDKSLPFFVVKMSRLEDKSLPFFVVKMSRFEDKSNGSLAMQSQRPGAIEVISPSDSISTDPKTSGPPSHNASVHEVFQRRAILLTYYKSTRANIKKINLQKREFLMMIKGHF